MSYANITELPVLKYAAIEQAKFAAAMEATGKKAITTFYADLSIAEFYGPDAVRETYGRVLQQWGANVTYWTEFVIALNWKIWDWYEKKRRIGNRL